MSIKKFFRLLLISVLIILLVCRSVVPETDQLETFRAYTRDIEFDYVSWILDSLAIKASMAALDIEDYLPETQKHEIVTEYIDLTGQQSSLTDQITRIYADPEISNPDSESQTIQEQLAEINQRLDEISLTAESILQDQITQVVGDLGLSIAGQPIPPVWYHSSPVPMALIISPRDTIRQDADISILADLSVDQINDLETRISQDQNVSALVVPIGGIGVYPTMVMRTNNLSWLAQTISHEWIHNYLTQRPLGLNYDTTSELRTMNETTASLAGKEIGEEVIRRYYPELAPKTQKADSNVIQVTMHLDDSTNFNFNSQMHEIRVTVDQLLSEGKIEEAEKYMDDSRQIFLENGYVVRKINQAYFAFYGAYADESVGAAGTDPVGPAVVKLREQSSSLLDFLTKISKMTSFEELQAAIQ